MDELRISLVQTSIVWEDKENNLKHFGKLIESLAGKSDIAVLPEAFSTGFSMRSPHLLAETNEGITIQTVQYWAKEFQMVICGSFFAKNNEDQLFNRAFFITPEGESFFYDKRHLFRMGEENKLFTAGNKIITVPYQDWNIRLIVCYDLRFPVWSRNVNNDYDLLICSANWPTVRGNVWSTLLTARAIENQCYVCGVNRTGDDGNGIDHQGDSILLDFKGQIVAECKKGQESIVTATISKKSLNEFRKKFPVWMDSDSFEIR